MVAITARSEKRISHTKTTREQLSNVDAMGVDTNMAIEHKTHTHTDFR